MEFRNLCPVWQSYEGLHRLPRLEETVIHFFVGRLGRVRVV